MQIDDYLNNEAIRKDAFPVTAERIFMAHAGVAPLPKKAVDAMVEFCTRGSSGAQENPWTNGQVLRARQVAAQLIGAHPDEITLLGPTALGLSLVANGFPWKTGDEVVFYPDDYPANVYPWTHLRDLGVTPVGLQPEHTGVITWDVVQRALTPSTRLVSLASCHFLSGYRIDIDDIGKRLHDRGVLLCIDGIQTLGAFPLSIAHVDFLSADSHKWLLGPAAAGIVYIRREHQEILKPSLLGSWNVVSPQFVAQYSIRYEKGGRRYEPGMLNLPGIIGMLASMDLLLDAGIESIGRRLLTLREQLLDTLRPLGYRHFIESFDLSERANESNRSGIVSVTHAERDMKTAFKILDEHKITASLRQDRDGTSFLRFSPHFYNTAEDIERVAQVLHDYAR